MLHVLTRQPSLSRLRVQVRIKEKNSKAFAVLGVDPTQAKLMSVLGIDMPMIEVRSLSRLFSP